MIHVGCGIIYHNEKILLVKKAYGKFKDKWEFPGGKRKENETIHKCVTREVFEETKCIGEANELISFLKITEKNLCLYFHNVNLLTTDIQLSKEHTEYMWVSINDAYNYDLIEWDYDLLDYLKFYFRKR